MLPTDSISSSSSSSGGNDDPSKSDRCPPDPSFPDSNDESRNSRPPTRYHDNTISQDNVPQCLWWLKDASMIKQAFEALCVNELQGLEFECDTKSR